MGRELAQRLGYPAAQLDWVPAEAIESFAGVGYHLISNGVINLCADKQAVLAEIARVLRPRGRMAISDIVTEKPLTESIVCDVNLWASCIGGAMQQDDYRTRIEDAGLKVHEWLENPQYGVISGSAQGATKTFGVKSVSILAVKA